MDNTTRKLRGLSLCSGVGGIDLALQPWTTITAYCEADRYCQAVLLSRMREGLLDRARIWTNLRTLNRQGELNNAGIEIIFGGPPCQDFSTMGTGAGLEGKRGELFFKVIRLVREIRPQFVFLENVAAISSRGLDRIVAELSALRYDCRWGVFSAQEVGAPHIRRRLFCLATNTDSQFLSHERKEVECDLSALGGRHAESGNNGEEESISHSNCEGKSGLPCGTETQVTRIGSSGNDVDGASSLEHPLGKCDSRQSIAKEALCAKRGNYGECYARYEKKEIESRMAGSLLHGISQGVDGDKTSIQELTWTQYSEEGIPRTCTQVPYQQKRRRCIGNSVVIQQARLAFMRLMGLVPMDFLPQTFRSNKNE